TRSGAPTFATRMSWRCTSATCGGRSAPASSKRFAASAIGWRRMPERLRRALHSVRLRLTVVATVVFAAAFALASVALVWRVRVSLEDSVRARSVHVLQEAAAGLQAGVPVAGTGSKATW